MSRRQQLALTVVLTLGLPSSTPLAAAKPVTGGALRWTQFNVYDTGAAENTDRTWLGYTTSIGPPFTNGSASVDAPATGPTVTPQSARGAAVGYTHAFPAAAGGSYDAATGNGTLEFSGTLRYTSPAHGFTITLSNPQVVIAAGRAQLFATGSGSSGSGQSSSAGTPYDRTRPVFDLAVAAAPTTQGPDETTTVTGIAPAIATADMVWPGGSYPAGAGPDRQPNTFGTFAFEVSTRERGTPPPAAPKPQEVVQPTATGPNASPTQVAKPKVMCAATRDARRRARTTCRVRTDPRVRRLVVTSSGRRLAKVAVRAGMATVDLPRRRRELAFVALDARGREMARRTQTVGG